MPSESAANVLLDAFRRLGEKIVAWHQRCLADEERDWQRRYNEAMRWRDWQTCEELLTEREGRPCERVEARDRLVARPDYEKHSETCAWRFRLRDRARRQCRNH